MATSLKLVTWNTCGVRETAEVPEKRKKILETLTKLQSSVAFIQETHIGVNNVDCVDKISGWESFFSVHHPRSKGVAILIKDNLSFELINSDMDPTGSYIVLICKLLGKCFTLVNVYNHVKEHKVLQRLSEYLCQIAQGILIVAGDFNTIVNTDLDREYQTGHTEPLRPYLEEFISSLMLIDVWGCLHPYTCDSFTRYPWKSSNKEMALKKKKIQKTKPVKQSKDRPRKKRTHKSASRLDMILMPRNTVQFVQSCEIYTCKTGYISDHHPVVLSMRLPKPHCTKPIFQGIRQKSSRMKRPLERKAGEICEAEVLKALMSLVEYETPLSEKLENFKSNKGQKAKELKAIFNKMTREGMPVGFTDSLENNGWHVFRIEYMILATIFTRRLETFLQPSFKTKTIEIDYEHFVVISFCEKPQKIKGNFLKQAFSSVKQIHPSPPHDFRIVEKMLPSTDGYRLLREGCPLTPTLLTLSLKHLARTLKDVLKKSVVDVCHHRKCITVYMQAHQYLTLKQKIREFRSASGISLLPKVGRVWRQKSIKIPSVQNQITEGENSDGAH
ncbi:uncharacterized protein LOC130558278 [Triplophysa rosa]|uniref:uncharacterized protein LOC130558278 n=1 Tax=Triplophysa rosa TaxID=992332 RepID=UPI0025461A2B|nr:uncharacterized protein LOC130558278 [Triplophysa rosa]XP_057196600.1 uncharacterized protein LOC130558278 [Triplophysa rosa]